MSNRIVSGFLRPSIQQIKKAVEQSGYLLEQRVCPIIEKYGFLTTPNEPYQDQDTGKSREMDVHAVKLNSLYRDELWIRSKPFC
jgi:hypothetical protein